MKIEGCSITQQIYIFTFCMETMPDDPLETEQEQIAEDVSFIQEPTLSATRSKPTISASATATSTRSSREIVLFSLVDGPTASEDIANNQAVTTNQADQALNELHERGLVELLVPREDSQGPVFTLTVRGDKAIHSIDYEENS
jgi:DNA-binding MarR family transcriptional regulator